MDGMTTGVAERGETTAQHREAQEELEVLAGQQCWDLLLDHVLSFLPIEALWRCQGVAGAWRNTVGSTAWLWKSTRLPLELRPRLTPEAFTFMAKSAQGKVQEIDLRGVTKVDCSAFLLPGATMVSDVQVLRLNREEQSRTLPMAVDVCHGFPCLRVLDLRWCPAVDDMLTAHLCRAQCAHSLEDLNVRGCQISDEGVMCVARCCTALRVLDIGAWPYPRFRGVRSVSDICLFFIAQCAALRGDSFALESVCIAGRRGTSDEGVEALIEFVPRLNRLDVRHCQSVTQTQTSLSVTGEELDPRRTWRYGRFDNRIEVISDTSCEGAETPQEYMTQYGVVDGWSDMNTASGLWQLLQSIAAVRAAAELQARATAEAQAEDMLVEAAEVQARASEIHAQAIDMQAQAAEILTRVAEVQLQVTAMQAQAEDQGHVAARAQAAEMQAQVAQMQVHAAQMQVHAAQMQIRATEMQGQAAEMQASALSIRAQAATLSFAELTNTANTAIDNAAATNEAGTAAAGGGGPVEIQAPAEEVATDGAPSAPAAVGAAFDSGDLQRQGGHEGSVELGRGAESGPAEETEAAGAAVAGAAAQGDPDSGGETGRAIRNIAAIVAASGSSIAASARFDAVRAETARLTRTVRGLTAQVERVTLRERAHAAVLTREVESVTRRAEAFISEHRAAEARTENDVTTDVVDEGISEGQESQETSAGPVDPCAGAEEEAGAGGEAMVDAQPEPDEIREARARWRMRETEVAAKLAEIERVRARLRVIQRARDAEVGAARSSQEAAEQEPEYADTDTDREGDRQMAMVRERQRQRAMMREMEAARDRQVQPVSEEEAPRALGELSAEAERERVTEMQEELETMRAEHARLLSRRDAEIESVAAVEARLLAVRAEQQRLTDTVTDLRRRIERLRNGADDNAEHDNEEVAAASTATDHGAPAVAARRDAAADSQLDETADERGDVVEDQVPGPTWV